MEDKTNGPLAERLQNRGRGFIKEQARGAERTSTFEETMGRQRLRQTDAVLMHSVRG